MTRVKICGLTTLRDAEAALEYGADMIGFVFAESKRQMKPRQVWSIIRDLPISGLRVGVFSDQPAEKVIETAEFCGLDVVQLHGLESVAYCKKIATRFRVIKAIHVNATRSLTQSLSMYEKYTPLLESGISSGGSGKIWNWDRLTKKQKKYSLIVSGGLNLTNVTDCIKKINPSAVDVSSGIEKAPGVKNLNLMKQFIKKVKRC